MINDKILKISKYLNSIRRPIRYYIFIKKLFNKKLQYYIYL